MGRGRHNRRRAILDRPLVKRAFDFVTHDVWMIEVAGVSRFRAFLVWLSRIVFLSVRGLREHKSMVQAAALTYYTVLSIVPVMAVSFAVVRGLDKYKEFRTQTVEPFLTRAFGEAGTEAQNARNALDDLIEGVEKTGSAPLTIVGIALLLYTSVKLLTAVEKSLNNVWGVQRGRSWTRRFTDYIAIVFVTPIFLMLGTGLTAYLRSRDFFFFTKNLDVSFLVRAATEWLPLISVWLGLVFAYLALPNTRIPLRSGMLGGFIAAILWLASQNLYIGLQVGVAKYNGLYAGFASIPLLMIWIYLSWVIFLIGAQVTYAHQSVPQFTRIARTGTIDQAFKESLALRSCGRIAAAFLDGDEPLTASGLATDLAVSPRAATIVLDALTLHGILARTSEAEEEAYLPARDLDAISVADVLDALKTEEGSSKIEPRGRMDERIDRVLDGLRRETRESLHNYTLREHALTARESEGQEPVGGEETRPAESPG
ncbi:MAG: YihY/virulence factor BrkB family protein [Planctomycetota bacterium]|nr:YihY/virulence factor BrkB family protein [Planctomycetota bacterium]